MLQQQHNRRSLDRRDLQNSRTLSTERLDQAGYPGNRSSYYGGYRPGGIEEEFLSQPNPTFVPPPMAG